MRKIEDYHPITVFLYFVAVICVTMFSRNPFLSLISLAGAVCYFSMLRIPRAAQAHLFSLLLFLILTLINPIFSKSGETVLFFLNNRPITLEALCYGMNAAVSLVAALYWFRCFSQVMTTDRLLCVFSKISKKLALILTMSLRFVPLFKDQWHRIDDAQKTLGLEQDGNIVDFFKAKIKVTDTLITWAIEGGIITAQSMEARGYYIGRRRVYSRFRFRPSDIVLWILSLILAAGAVYSFVKASFVFYPAVTLRFDIPILLGYIGFFILSMLPVIINTQEVLRWKYLTSGI